MGVSLRAALAVTAAIAVAASAPPRAQTSNPGVISGRVVLAKRARGTPPPANVYSSRAVHRTDGPRPSEMRNVVVYVKGVTAPAGSLPVSRASIRQEGEFFSPPVLAVTKGSTVEFPNADPFFHNVFSLSRATSFDLGYYRQGESRSVTFTKPGLVKVYCHVHSHMSASILVLDHPYFTTPADDGSFSIGGLPPGAYTLVGWHERVGEQTKTITVTDGATPPVTLSLPLGDLP